MARQISPTIHKDIRKKCIHIETELGIVNVYWGMQDREGRDIEAVEMLPDPAWLTGRKVIVRNGRFIREVTPVPVEEDHAGL
jgi:hypothetical protein